MDELDIAPRRALPPVPPPPRGGTPALVAPVAPDETSWYDPHDLIEDSAVRPSSSALAALDALAAVDVLDRSGSAAEAAHDLLLESGRHLVLDDALLAALDAAAKAAEARRAITAGALTPTTSGSTALSTPTPAAGPVTGAAPARTLGPSTEVSAVRPALPALPALRATAVAPVHPAPATAAPVDLDVLDAEVLDVQVHDDEVHADEAHADLHAGVVDEPADEPAEALDADDPAGALDPLAVDVAAEFARHDDLVETGRHAALDDDLGYPTGRHYAVSAADTGRHGLVEDDDLDGSGAAHGFAAGVPTVGTLTHRTVVTRSSGRRWIPVGVGAGVLSIVAAVLLTSGFASNGPTTGTDEAARTGAGSSAPATSGPPTPSSPVPAMNTLDLSGPVVVDDSAQPEDVADARPTAAAGRSTAAVQPQVAAPPATSTGTAPDGSSTSGSGEGTSTQPTVLTAETGPPSGGSAGTSSTGSSSTPTTSTSTPAPETVN